MLTTVLKVPYLWTGFERKGGSAWLLDLLLYKLYACAPWFGVFGEKVQRYAGKYFVASFSSILVYYLRWSQYAQS